jgi:hypothetical protein
MSYNSDMLVVIKKTFLDGIGNVLKGFITCLSVHAKTVIECNPDYVFGNYDTILEDEFIYKPDENIIPEYAYTSRLVVTREEEWSGQQNIVNEYTQTNGCGNPILNDKFFSNYLIDSNYDPSLLIDKLKMRIINTISKIKFKPIIWEEVNNITSNINYSNNNVLGISIRTWKCHHESDINKKYSADEYKNQIANLINNNPTIDTVILSLDNHDYLEEYVEHLVKFPVKIYLLKKASHINELQFALIKTLVLSKSHFLIGSRISTFTELIFWFSECKIKVTPIL